MGVVLFTLTFTLMDIGCFLGKKELIMPILLSNKEALHDDDYLNIIPGE